MSGTLGQSQLRTCVKCALKVILGLGLCCLVYLLVAKSSGTSSYLRQRNASLAQAAIVSRHLRELSLKQFSSRALQTAFRMAGQLMQSSQQTAAHPRANTSQNHSAESSLLLNKALDILTALSTAKPVVSCKMDSTLLLNMSDIDKKVLLAANMHNNEDLLPHFTLQMLDLLSKLPLGSAFLSIYESGSTDSTGVLLHLSAVGFLSHFYWQLLRLYTLSLKGFRLSSFATEKACQVVFFRSLAGSSSRPHGVLRCSSPNRHWRVTWHLLLKALTHLAATYCCC